MRAARRKTSDFIIVVIIIILNSDLSYVDWPPPPHPRPRLHGRRVTFVNDPSQSTSITAVTLTAVHSVCVYMANNSPGHKAAAPPTPPTHLASSPLFVPLFEGGCKHLRSNHWPSPRSHGSVIRWLHTHKKREKKNTSKQSKFALRDLLRNQFFDTLMDAFYIIAPPWKFHIVSFT